MKTYSSDPNIEQENIGDFAGAFWNGIAGQPGQEIERRQPTKEGMKASTDEKSCAAQSSASRRPPACSGQDGSPKQAHNQENVAGNVPERPYGYHDPENNEIYGWHLT